eukprot:gb/GECG01005735.1/.p1 GENE.gb/GECG01005735.1/~~gb/GECG01005735.1/.p1  ORF type:complete len:129 (+),score=7.94 gb/GECG01005735.1/:1-387(+)
MRRVWQTGQSTDSSFVVRTLTLMRVFSFLSPKYYAMARRRPAVFISHRMNDPNVNSFQMLVERLREGDLERDVDIIVCEEPESKQHKAPNMTTWMKVQADVREKDKLQNLLARSALVLLTRSYAAHVA